MENQVIILGAKPYDFADQKTGRQVSGVTVWVLPTETEDGVNGLIPAKYTLTNEQYQKLAYTTLPARATLGLTYHIASKKVKFNEFSDVEPVTFD